MSFLRHDGPGRAQPINPKNALFLGTSVPPKLNPCAPARALADAYEAPTIGQITQTHTARIFLGGTEVPRNREAINRPRIDTSARSFRNMRKPKFDVRNSSSGPAPMILIQERT